MRPLQTYDYRAIARNLVIDPAFARLARWRHARLVRGLVRVARLALLLPCVLLWSLAVACLFALRELIEIWCGSDSVVEKLLREWTGRR